MWLKDLSVIERKLLVDFMRKQYPGTFEAWKNIKNWILARNRLEFFLQTNLLKFLKWMKEKGFQTEI